MSIHWVMSYYILQEKAAEFLEFMKSDRVKELNAELEKETGIKYVDTYMPALGFGEYDCEDWFVAPDWAAFDKLRTSKAFGTINVEVSQFLDERRPWGSRALRSVQDVQPFKPPEEE